MVTLAVTSCGAAPPAEEPPPVPDEVTGAITQIERSEEGGITAFTVRTPDERTFEVRVVRGRDYGFDLEHLEEHRTSGDPVRVTLEQRGETAFAAEIVDA